jgi:hypothetical protein
MMGDSLVLVDRDLINKKGWRGWARPGLGTTHETVAQPKLDLQ